MHVVVIGGGFGGLVATRALADAPVQVTLIDKRNFHLFQPLLYQVATAGLAPGDIAEPIRHVLARQRNVDVLLGTAVRVDLGARKVVISDGTSVAYDKLIVATGATHAYFGHPEWGKFAPGLKTIGDALEMRRKILSVFERAEWCADATERVRLMTFAIVGGGPTGVELAGAIREIAAATMLRDFRHINTATTRVVLVEAMPAILAGYPEGLRAKARRQLEDLGVEVRTNAEVTHIDERGLHIGDEVIETHNVFWAAGVRAEPLGATLGAPLDRVGRVLVNRDLTVPGVPDVYVIGDLAAFAQDGSTLPGVAQVAMQMAVVAARNLRADIEGRPHKEFRYHDRGAMATIGRRRAVAALPYARFSGFMAWLIWAFIHVLFLISYRNRIVVFTKWILSYFVFDRGSRILWQDEGWIVEKKASEG